MGTLRSVMRFLSRIEEILLIAIWKLGDNAYGITIRKQVAKDTGVKWVSGAIYGTLARLLKNGYVVAAKGEPTAERGGRHKIYYTLSKTGKEKLAQIQELNNNLWLQVPKVIVE